MTSPHEAPDETFARSLRNVRTALGMSQDTLAEAMAERGFGFYVTTVGKIERGARRVTIGEAVSIAQILGVPLQSLTEGELAQALAAHNRARNEFSTVLNRYVDAMVAVAFAADASDELDERQQSWLSDEFFRQTPMHMIQDARYAASAAVSRRGGSLGDWAGVLIDCIEADASLIETEIDRRDRTAEKRDG